MSTQAYQLISKFLAHRLDAPGREFLERGCEELGKGISNDRFAALIALASRQARRTPLGLSPAECAAAGEVVPGWNPERWNLLETLRIALILARRDLGEASFVNALEDCFRYADEGEMCAFYRALAVLPGGERFRWRAAEGCRTNMISVFEAVACDSPYPVRYFDDTAWRQLVIKAVFVNAPLWRVYGLDTRLSADLARMALDLADERHSAGRPIPPQLWLCLGTFGDDRAVEALETELRAPNPEARRGAVLALGRAGAVPRLLALIRTEADPSVRATIEQALRGRHDQTQFRDLTPKRP